MTISEERLRQTMLDHGVTESRIEEILTELRTPPEADPAAPASTSTGRQRLLVVSDPDGRCRNLELTGWVIKVDDNFAIGDLASRLMAAGVDHNLAARNRNSMVRTIGEVLDGASTRILRERGIYRQHREPVFVTFVGRTDLTRVEAAPPVNPVNQDPPPSTPYPEGPPAVEPAPEPAPEPDPSGPVRVVEEEESMTA